MKLQPISYETALLAKEKGFDVDCYDYYDKEKSNSKPRLTKGIEYVAEDFDCFCTPYIAFDWNNNREASKQIRAPYPNKWSKHQASAPSQYLLQKWLWEKHLIWIEVNLENNRCFEVIARKNVDKTLSFSWGYDSPEEALEKGLQEALKTL